jgi:hypothetical protein
LAFLPENQISVDCRYIRNHRIWLRIVSTIYCTFNQKKSRAIAGAAFINRDQVLGGGSKCEIADMRIYHSFFRGSKVVIGDINRLVERFLHVIFAVSSEGVRVVICLQYLKI